MNEKKEKKESGSFADQMVSWGNDLMYLLKNKSYMLSTAAFTCLTFCTGALSWFGPELVENALKVRQEHQLDGFENDIKVEEYVHSIFHFCLKFTFFEKATKICAIFLMIWTFTKSKLSEVKLDVKVQTMRKIGQIFVAFLEKLNFNTPKFLLTFTVLELFLELS